jgi:hypothetical protein
MQCVSVPRERLSKKIDSEGEPAFDAVVLVFLSCGAAQKDPEQCPGLIVLLAER